MILENEKISFEEEVDNWVQLSDDEINKKYIAGEVRIVTEQARYPLDTICMMIESGNYNLNPDFQRRRRWSVQKKSKLIESFIMNVPIPPIFLYENEFSHYEVMDGLQRLTTIYDFYKDGFELEGLQLWEELNGKCYSKLPEKVRKGIDRRYISSIILLQESANTDEKAAEMKQMVFERINSGGVQLEPQETRNALYDGKMNQLCISLSRNEYLCRFLNIPSGDINNICIQKELEKNEAYKKMDDVEYVLRFFAMRQLEGYSKRKLSDFLDYYLKNANDFDDELLDQLGKLFEDTIRLAYNLLGEKAFYMYRKRTSTGTETWNWFSRTTTTIYDPLMQVLSDYTKNPQQLLDQRDRISKSMCDFYKENYAVFEGRNNNRADIEKRIEKLKGFFTSFLCV